MLADWVLSWTVEVVHSCIGRSGTVQYVEEEPDHLIMDGVVC